MMKKSAVASFILFYTVAFTAHGQTNTFPPSGNTGVGTTSPGTKLHIVGSTATPGDFTGYPSYSNGNVWPNGFVPEILVERPYGYAGTGGLVTYRGGIGLGLGSGIYSLNPNPAGSTYYGDIRFHTTYWTGSAYQNADRMIITYTGDVGIGTTNPNAKLTVAGNVSFGERHQSSHYIGHTASNAFGGNSAWQLFATDGTDEWISFGTLKNGVGGGERMRIDPSGNMSIGTSSPGAKLHVVSATGSPGDFVGYTGSSVGSIWPKGIVPETIFEHPYTAAGRWFRYLPGRYRSRPGFRYLLC